MKIDLQEPFKSLWMSGYVVTNTENRRNVVLYNTPNDRSTISYARYLMCVHLGYILSPELEVDHINDDKTDDRLDNLQVLTAEQNRLKREYNYIMNQQVVYGVHCAYCKIPFLLTERDLNAKLAKGVEYPFCSRSCAVNYDRYVTGRNNLYSSELSDKDKRYIKELRAQGLSSYMIADITDFSRNTVMKYWK